MKFSLRALLLVMLKNYIVIFNTTNYKIEATLIEPKRNILASHLPCAVFFFLIFYFVFTLNSHYFIFFLFSRYPLSPLRLPHFLSFSSIHLCRSAAQPPQTHLADLASLSVALPSLSLPSFGIGFLPRLPLVQARFDFDSLRSLDGLDLDSFETIDIRGWFGCFGHSFVSIKRGYRIWCRIRRSRRRMVREKEPKAVSRSFNGHRRSLTAGFVVLVIFIYLFN